VAFGGSGIIRENYCARDTNCFVYGLDSFMFFYLQVVTKDKVFYDQFYTSVVNMPGRKMLHPCT
jgi:hypothetical protein